MSDEAEPVSERAPVTADEPAPQRTGTVRCSGWMCDLEAALRHLMNAQDNLLRQGEHEIWSESIEFGVWLRETISEERLRSHIDPKLSDRRGWRDRCAVAARRRRRKQRA